MNFQDPVNLFLLFSLFFLPLFLLCVGVSQYLRKVSRARELVQKIRRGGVGGDVPEKADISETASRSLATPFHYLFSSLGKSVKQDKLQDYSGLRLKFLRAGLRWDNSGGEYWGAKIFFCLLLLSGFIAIRMALLKSMDASLTAGIAAAIALAGFYLPNFVLQAKASQRKEIISKGLPDAIDLLVVCVDAGMGLDSAFNRVAKEIEFASPVLNQEFKLLNLELRAGKLRQDALQNLALRTGLDEINSLVTLLIQAEQFGTSVARTLRIYSDSFRTSRFNRAEEIAAKLPVKLLLPLIFFIFPSLFVVLVGPAAIKIYQNLLMP